MTFKPQYKITDFISRLGGKGRVIIVMYLLSGVGDGDDQGKLKLKVVGQGRYLEATIFGQRHHKI